MKVGIIGAGGIAVTMARTLNQMEDATAYAVASRSLEKAETFAKEHQVEKAYGSYEEMLQDPEVELVYVATPHSHHYECMKLALCYGKPVLCEKAFTANAEQAEEILSISEEKKLFVGEAMWTRLYGDKGYLIAWNINNVSHIQIFDNDRKLLREEKVPAQITGFEYEVRAAMEAIRDGKMESPQMPHSETLYMMRLMDGLRKRWGVRYPFE